ncbi:sensor histidine kinase [Sphingobacterium sp. MYb382]|uniref:sensor histidine kinase n=1 Tax=Sphingobacterium sp. MYb382 TaxID=2745278 RepID=UPI00309D5CBB
MSRTKNKRILLVIFSFIGSYLTLFLIFPWSYWEAYFSLSFPRLSLELFMNLIFCALIIELSLFIDKRLEKRIPWLKKPLKRLVLQTIFQIIGVILLVIVMAIIYQFVANPIQIQPGSINIRQSLYSIIAIILWALMISAFNTGDYLLRSWKKTILQAADFEIKAAQHKQLASEVELQALKLQLDPHFVFNNLSVLSELILQDQQLGYEYTENFTKVYRYLLLNAKKKLIPLREELDFLETYIFLIRIRMGDGSRFNIHIDSEKQDMLIPPLTLQLLIENALKYNRTDEEDPLQIDIYVNADDELVVSNRLLPLIQRSSSTGIGLNNIISRYALLGDKIPSIEKDDTTFTIKVPLLR